MNASNLTTTISQVRAFEPFSDGFAEDYINKLLKKLGSDYGEDTPITLAQFLDALGLEKTLFSLAVFNAPEFYQSLVRDYAARVTHLAAQGPSKKLNATQKAVARVLSVMQDDDYTVLWDVARMAAWAVARVSGKHDHDAAAAERQWQEERLIGKPHETPRPFVKKVTVHAPKGTCQHCGELRPLYTNGTVRDHGYYPLARFNKIASMSGGCEGVGKPPLETSRELADNLLAKFKETRDEFIARHTRYVTPEYLTDDIPKYYTAYMNQFESGEITQEELDETFQRLQKDAIYCMKLLTRKWGKKVAKLETFITKTFEEPAHV